VNVRRSSSHDMAVQILW